MHRTRTGKNLSLTSRDLEIFRTLCRYRFLRSTYLYAFVGGESEKRFKERLGDLFHEGYLDRPTEQWRFSDARFLPVVHELGRGGREAMMAAATPGSETITWLRDGPHRQFEHSLMICEVLASIELAVHEREDLQFISWPEILARAPPRAREVERPYLLRTGDECASIIPDALFAIAYLRDGRTSYRFFALEADRGAMPVARVAKTGTSVMSKLASYREIIGEEAHRACLGIPNLLVLMVTTNQARCEEMVRRFGEAGEAPLFLFKAMGPGPVGTSRPRLDVLRDSFDRPGLPPLRID